MAMIPHLGTFTKRMGKRGFALLVAVIFMSVMLTFGLALASISYKQQVLASSAVQSQAAFYAADAGLECALYADQQQGLFEYTSDLSAQPPDITCDNTVAIADSVISHTSAEWDIYNRLSLNSGKQCADVTVYKPAPPASGGGGAFIPSYSSNSPGTGTYVVPPGATQLEVKTWGGGGGGGGKSVGGNSGAAGGGAGYAGATINVAAGENLNMYVGGGGNGGGNGGGFGGAGGGGGGGGYTGIARGSTFLVLAPGGAGGGGGGGGVSPASGAGGVGGGTTGGVGGGTHPGTGGTQSAGGIGGSSAGTLAQNGSSLKGGSGGGFSAGPTAGGAGGIEGGGNGQNGGSSGTAGGGGGGGGYFGGGGGGANNNNGAGGAGGGSDFIDPSASSAATLSGSGQSAGNNTDGDYASSAGAGANAGSAGSPGLIVIYANIGSSGAVVATTPTYLFSQGYDVPCSTVDAPNGARFTSRGLEAHY